MTLDKTALRNKLLSFTNLSGNEIYRREKELSDAGLLKSGGRGKNAPKVTSRECALILLSQAAETVKETSAAAMSLFIAQERSGGTANDKPVFGTKKLPATLGGVLMSALDDLAFAGRIDCVYLYPGYPVARVELRQINETAPRQAVMFMPDGQVPKAFTGLGGHVVYYRGGLLAQLSIEINQTSEDEVEEGGWIVDTVGLREKYEAIARLEREERGRLAKSDEASTKHSNDE